MGRFKLISHAQIFLDALDAYAAVSNHFNLGRHIVSANHYRNLREGAFNNWGRAIARVLTMYLSTLDKLTYYYCEKDYELCSF